jgi:hypothetical protein
MGIECRKGRRAVAGRSRPQLVLAQDKSRMGRLMWGRPIRSECTIRRHNQRKNWQVPENQNHHLNFHINLTSHASAVAAISAVSVALEIAVQAAIFADPFDQEAGEARLNALTARVLREVTQMLTDRMADSDEATGVIAAIAIIGAIL